MINISNHPSAKWGEKQIQAAKSLWREKVIDIPFPDVPPNAETSDISIMANEYLKMLENYPKDVVHLMGEMGFTYKLINRLKFTGYTVVHSTTERKSIENPDGTKTVQFEFVQFREY